MIGQKVAAVTAIDVGGEISDTAGPFRLQCRRVQNEPRYVRFRAASSTLSREDKRETEARRSTE